MEEQVRKAIDALRRLRVRQGDFMSVLECLIAHSTDLARIAQQGPLHEVAIDTRARAHEIHQIGNSVPKFVVEDLVDESIKRLEASLVALTRAAEAGEANG